MVHNYAQKNNINYNLIPIQFWCLDCSLCFYKDLEIKLQGKLSIVKTKNNKRFMFTYSFKETKYYEQYLKLCIKIYQDNLTFCLFDNNEGKRKNKKDFFVEKLLNRAIRQNIKLEKSGQLGSVMSIAKLKGSYLIKNKNGTINLSETVNFLNKLTNLI